MFYLITLLLSLIVLRVYSIYKYADVMLHISKDAELEPFARFVYKVGSSLRRS